MVSAADSMTPRKRIESVIEGKDPDRVPIVPFSSIWIMKYGNTKFIECLEHPDLFIQATLKFIEDFSPDMVSDFIGYGAVIEALGASLVLTEYESPSLPEKTLIHSVDDVKRLKPIDLTNGKIPFLLSLMSDLRKAVPGDIPVVGRLGTPFRGGNLIRGVDNFMMDMLTEPGLTHALMDFLTDQYILYAKGLVEAGADAILLTNPHANGTFISRKQYEEFSHPYIKRLISRTKDLGPIVIFHTCGKWNDRMDLVIAEGADIYFTDDMDMNRTKQLLGSKGAVMGNVNVVQTMLQSNLYDVEREALDCIHSTAPGGRYILSGNCFLPRDVPVENVRALFEAGRKFGGYPLEFRETK